MQRIQAEHHIAHDRVSDEVVELLSNPPSGDGAGNGGNGGGNGKNGNGNGNGTAGDAEAIGF